ncbi:hypothetical protein TNCV_3149301 [Trichonephila clavipes]|nr:hypothetical protein TNCV_3149301 [Trichonephila clavipes]
MGRYDISRRRANLICKWPTTAKFSGIQFLRMAATIQGTPNKELVVLSKNGIWKEEIVNPDDPDQDNGTKLLNYCNVRGPGQVSKISN